MKRGFNTAILLYCEKIVSKIYIADTIATQFSLNYVKNLQFFYVKTSTNYVKIGSTLLYQNMSTIMSKQVGIMSK